MPILLGGCGILAMVLLAAAHGMFLPWHHALGGLSVVSILIGLAWLNEARWKELAGSGIYTIFFLICMGLLYLISANRDERWDLTADRVHTLSPLTESVLRLIPPGDHLTIQAFAVAEEHPALQEFLASYERRNSQLTFELYDAKRDLTVVADLGGDVKNDEAVITRWDAAGKMVRRETSSLPVSGQTRENDLTNAISRMFSTSQQVVYFTTGHGEKRADDTPHSLTKVVKELASKGIPIKPLRLMEGKIPDDAGAVIMAGPTIDLLNFERELLEQYLREGGKLFLLIDPMLPAANPLDNVEQLLATLNVRSDNVFIVDPDGIGITSIPLTPVVGFMKHAITEATNQSPFVLETARQLEAITPLPAGLSQEALLITSKKVWTEKPSELRSTRRAIPPDDPKAIGTRCVAVAVEMKTGGGRYGDDMRAVVVTDSDAFTDQNLEKNGDAGAFFVQSVQWLRQQDDLLQVPPKFLTSTPINLTQSRAWILLAAYAAIGLFVTIGGTTWALVRRRRG
ncbi:GldG family protein [Candidatus Sumerlaeota bacterium]|nr:GldG family protein [Candidatus Sumerlaeota bacterium]